MGKAISLSPEQIKMIERVVSDGKRVEIIPVKDGVRLFIQKREEIRA